jgi:hypothetical protein
MFDYRTDRQFSVQSHVHIHPHVQSAPTALSFVIKRTEIVPDHAVAQLIETQTGRQRVRFPMGSL